MGEIHLCKKDSAWHRWQIQGYQWAVHNPGVSAVWAARRFATQEDWPKASHKSRYRAFMEGAKAAEHP